jgi:hypothetical protein
MNNIIDRCYRSVFIKEGHLKAVYERNEPCDGCSLITYENRTPVHPDLTEAMQRFAKHVRNISGLSIVQKLFVLGYICINSGNCQLLRIYSRVGEGCEDMGRKGISSLESRLYLGRGEYYDENSILEIMEKIEKESNAYIDRGKTFEGECAFVIDNEDLLNLQKSES